ncbi:hypothetical protein HDU93_006787 [Gonapodya sp. JEL0774]|nr:hypothetical protein HDU93_006787 [Gonapodya sp. JEL0774]
MAIFNMSEVLGFHSQHTATNFFTGFRKYYVSDDRSSGKYTFNCPGDLPSDRSAPVIVWWLKKNGVKVGGDAPRNLKDGDHHAFGEARANGQHVMWEDISREWEKAGNTPVRNLTQEGVMSVMATVLGVATAVIAA